MPHFRLPWHSDADIYPLVVVAHGGFPWHEWLYQKLAQKHRRMVLDAESKF